MSNGNIIICDDEPHLREMVAEYLAERGFDVREAENADALFDCISDGTAPDLIVLDINMPGQNGLAALQRLRQETEVPVIMLTAAADVIDRVVGLEMGADDYLGKPVDLRELEARIKAAIRRWPAAGRGGEPAPPANQSCLAAKVPFGSCCLDLDAARLFDTEGQEIPVTAMEFNLLRVFAENRGRVLNRDQLLERAHDRGWEPFDRSIDLRISRLRRKIERNPSKPEVIRTVRGIGYIFG
ncbi:MULTISPECIES: response regulator [unclassified Ruegeria]|uniref:response regulator n=1 Tax=unclassified Ruegeria TaxID=2625375 RepID=UPI001489D1DD|nr:MULTISPECIES: response regulator transcription factor [unclassified Ruegeria]